MINQEVLTFFCVGEGGGGGGGLGEVLYTNTSCRLLLDENSTTDLCHCFFRFRRGVPVIFKQEGNSSSIVKYVTF